MKKIYLLINCIFLFGLISCSSDDSSNKQEENNPTTKEWIPTKISLGSIYSLDYPHTVGCQQDFIRILSNNSAIFFSHEQGTCDIEETPQNWVRNGNQINLTFLDTQISGTVKEETADKFVIEAKASQFSNVITTLYPDLANLIPLLGTMNLQIILIKK